jgi:hypothetical protein
MSTLRYCIAAFFCLLVVFSWFFFFRNELRRWWIERGPRKQLAREMALERKQEQDRLRDELASKYLPPGTDGAAKP